MPPVFQGRTVAEAVSSAVRPASQSYGRKSDRHVIRPVSARRGKWSSAVILREPPGSDPKSVRRYGISSLAYGFAARNLVFLYEITYAGRRLQRPGGGTVRLTVTGPTTEIQVRFKPLTAAATLAISISRRN